MLAGFLSGRAKAMEMKDQVGTYDNEDRVISAFWAAVLAGFLIRSEKGKTMEIMKKWGFLSEKVGTYDLTMTQQLLSGPIWSGKVMMKLLLLGPIW